MTLQIAFLLAILGMALVLFVTEWVRADLVALIVLCLLGITGLVTPTEALAGFSNPAVVTIWAMFILSAGLAATGVADFIGERMLAVSGRREPKVILVIMLVSGALSAFMNNIGVAAMMLPVVMDMARRTGLPPSRLLMPMAFATLLGGLTTLVGTSLNLVAAGTLEQAGLASFGLFTFTPIGVPALIIGSLFVAFVGRHLLPREMPAEWREAEGVGGWHFSHALEERTFFLRVGEGSPFAGAPLSRTALGPLLGITVRAVQRAGQTHAAVGGDFVLEGGDVLEVQGRREEFGEFLRWNFLEVATGTEIAGLLSPRHLVLATVTVAPGGEVDGLTVLEADFRRRFQAHILAVAKGGRVVRDGLGHHRLQGGDRLHVELRREDFAALQAHPAFSAVEVLGEEDLASAYPADDSLLEMDIPAGSTLAGRTVAQTALHEALGLRILVIGRKPEAIFFPEADEVIRPGDKLLAHGGPASVERMHGLQALEPVQEEANGEKRPHRGEELVEVTLAPDSSLAGKTLRELNFRRRYGLQVVSIWRAGRAYRSHLRNFTVEFGDALLLAGRHAEVLALAPEEDFIFLTPLPSVRKVEAKKTHRAPRAAAIMLVVVGLVVAGVLPVAIAALAGATMMVLTRCLTIEAAHRAIEWKSVFLIACMLPLGAAMQGTGAALWIAEGLVAVSAPLGIWFLLVGLYIITAAATAVIPAAAVVLIMANVAIDVAMAAGLPPQMVVMTVAMAAVASFTSPVSHPSNILVMGPGGYRFADYTKLGLGLALIVMCTVLPVIVWLWMK